MAKINSDVFFISPDGKIVPVHEGRHINAILKYPKVFGFTKAQLTKWYAKHGETIGFEGYAREEIMLDVITRGWIRVRFLPRNSQFIFQIQRLTPRVKENIWTFLNGVKSKAITVSSPVFYPDILVMDTTAGAIISGELKDAMKKLYEKTSKHLFTVRQLHELEDMSFKEYLRS